MGIFDEIYSGNGWGFGSGHGSLPSVTKGYRKFIEDFIRDNNIKSVVDYGCGDWQFSRMIDWNGTSYTGLDIVESVIQENTKHFGTSRIKFKAIKPGETNTPAADLLIVKDVLQHQSEKSVKEFIKKVIPKYKFVLVTNCVIPVEDLNAHIADGEFRPLDIRKAPYNVAATSVYDFVGPKTFARKERKWFPAWKKLVLLVTN